MFLIKKRRSAITFSIQNFSGQSLLKSSLRKKQPFSFRKHGLGVCISCLRKQLDGQLSIEVYVMFRITNLIEPCLEKLILNHFIRNNYPEFRSGPLESQFFKLTLGSFPDQSPSNQSFQGNSLHITSLDLTHKLFFELRFCIFIIKGYYTKSKRLQSLNFWLLYQVTLINKKVVHMHSCTQLYISNYLPEEHQVILDLKSHSRGQSSILCIH